MVDGSHQYTQHLTQLDSYRPPWAQGKSGRRTTPLILEAWTELLRDHPDKEYVSYILEGIKGGFRVGFQWGVCPLAPSQGNMPIAKPERVSQYLERELELGRIRRVPSSDDNIQISPLGLIPKKNKPDSWRLIVDLSSPKGASVNDGIDRSLASLAYVTVEHLVSLILAQGGHPLLVKADIKEAYRMVPVHPDDHCLLGVKWEEAIYVDERLPFGLRSAPKIFSAIADAIQWILDHQGVGPSLHYLDDFILVGVEEKQAGWIKEELVAIFGKLGVPLEPSKLEGPATQLTFLGIEVDTTSHQLRLPQDKLRRLGTLLESTMGRKALRLRDLQSLVGLLQHAAQVVRPGRSFVRRLHALLAGKESARGDQLIRLNRDARADIIWWRLFTEQWNGISMMWVASCTSPEVRVVSDASGHWGCGVYCLPKWMTLQWTPCLQGKSIQVKELIPVVLAAGVWGRGWTGKVVEFVVDNQAVVAVLQSGYSKEEHLMHLLRVPVWLASHFQFWFVASHIAGKDNTLADAISRNNSDLFLSQVSPSTELLPVVPPPALVDLLSHVLPWTSAGWMKQFDIITRQL